MLLETRRYHGGSSQRVKERSKSQGKSSFEGRYLQQFEASRIGSGEKCQPIARLNFPHGDTSHTETNTRVYEVDCSEEFPGLEKGRLGSCLDLTRLEE